MPYSFSQMFTNGRGSNEVTVDKPASRLMARRRSTGSLKHGNVRKNSVSSLGGICLLE